jgi:hypothetical protein
MVFASALGLVLLLGLAAVVRDVTTRKNGSAFVLVGGLALLFVGERVFGEGDWRVPVSAAGELLVFAALGLRAYAWSQSSGARREGHRQGLLWSSLVVLGIVVYGLTLPMVTDRLGFDEEALARWNGVWSAVFPILILLGLAPTFLLDRLLVVHPVQMPAGAAREAQISGVIAALAIALVFPVNYIAASNDEEWDVAYFRTTRPGESTIATVKTSAEPIEAVLFFPAGNDASRETAAYFNALANASDGRLTVKVVDQALDPKLAEDLKVRENGNVVLVSGETNEKFKIDTDLDKAKRDLRKLDSLVQKHLMKLTRGPKTIYFLTGHDEANWRDSENPLRKINLYKKDVLEAQNYKVKTFGVAEGSANAVPDDASLVVVAAPLKPLLAEETQVLEDYFDKGGTLLVLIDPEGDHLTDLLAHLGVDVGAAPLANAEAHVRLYGGPADRILLATNKYGSHATVKTLSRNSQVAQFVLPGAVSVTKAEGTPNKVATLLRSMPNTWADADGDFEASTDETKKVWDLALAVTKDVGEGEDKKEARAIVVGDVGFLADDVIRAFRANAQFGYDAARWLSGDEDITGEVESEEDVKVQHTREEDWMWFLTAIGAVPTTVLMFGVLFIRLRRRRDR